MVAYADSSFLVSLYIEDSNTASAQSYLARNQHTLFLTNFSKSESEHAIRTLAFRKRITVGEMTQGLLHLERDLERGNYQMSAVEEGSLFHKATQLSNRHALEFGVRYLDMLHVASALLVNARRFQTFDLRQRKLAQAAGLDVKL
jgi:predicted nucleic acid-binding protein